MYRAFLRCPPDPRTVWWWGSGSTGWGDRWFCHCPMGVSFFDGKKFGARKPLGFQTYKCGWIFVVWCSCMDSFISSLKWAIPFNKGTPPYGWQSFLPTLGQKFCLDSPRTDSSLQRITENSLKFTREYRDILACQYPLGQTLENHP